MGDLHVQLSESAKQLLTAPGGPSVSTGAPGIACFVDLARFTTISEALGREGSAGTERLVELINRFFTPAIDAAVERGGDIVGFGGDALTLVFPADALPTAIDWGSTVMDAIDRISPIETGDGQSKLEAKIGIADGHTRTLLVGPADARREVTAGSAIDRAVMAENRLGPGEIGLLVDPNCLPPGTDQRGDVALITRQTKIDDLGRLPADDAPSRQPSIGTSIDDDVVRPFVPDRVIDRLHASGPALLNEHRPATVLFVGLDDPAVDGEIHTNLTVAMAIIGDHGGTTISVGTGDKGTTLLAAFGAPVAFTGQRSAAVFAAADLLATLRCQAGVASGLCFTGIVGADRRWNYNLIGDVANTAARLMTEARPGDVLVDEATAHAADPRLVWGAWAEHQLRGRSEPVRAALLEAIDTPEHSGSDLPLIGRLDEMDRLRSALLDVVETRTGRGIVLTGQSGVGKTRLIAEAIDLAHGLGFRTAAGSLGHRPGHRSYGPFIPAIFDVIGLAGEAGPAEFEAALQARLDPGSRLPALVRSVVFGGHAEHELLAGLDAKAAAEIVEQAFADLIVGSDEPLLLVVDDADDLDEASTRLLRRVASAAEDHRVVLLAAAYPDGDVRSWPDLTVIPVGELDRSHALELVVDHHRKATLDLDDEALAAIVDQVGGNPQLLRILTDYVGAGHHDLPNDARSIVLGRFDRLPAATQGALAMASTLGRHFFRHDFLGAFADHRVDHGVLDELRRQRLVECPDADAVSFASPLLWQVAYEASSHAGRQDFHRSVGLHLERLPSGVESRVEDLAHHFGFTPDVERHRRYFGPAARRAQRAFANGKAIEWFERAIDVAESDDVGRLRFELGSTIEHVGRWDDAAEMFRAAADDEGTRPTALASLARLQLVTDSYDVARSTIGHALAAAETLNDPNVTEWVLEKASLVHTHAGNIEAAADAANQQIRAATVVGDELRMAAALSNSGAAKSWSGDLDGARRELRRALAVLNRRGALAMAADVEVDLGMVELDRGEFDQCLAHLQAAEGCARSIGYRRTEASATGNRALALVSMERYDEATPPIRTALRLLIDVGDTVAMASPLGLSGVTSLVTSPSTTIGLLARVIRIGRRSATVGYRDRAYGVLVEAYEGLRDGPRAERCRDQRSRDEADVTDAEIEDVAPMTPPAELGLDPELEELLTKADALIERLG